VQGALQYYRAEPVRKRFGVRFKEGSFWPVINGKHRYTRPGTWLLQGADTHQTLDSSDRHSRGRGSANIGCIAGRMRLTVGERIVDLPDEYRKGTGLLEVRHEEEAIVWLWAFPSRFPWPTRPTWLYTPVVGKERWPGDLWGVDREGNLLIVECKQCRRNDDPFLDFTGFNCPTSLQSEYWRAKFRGHLQAELSMPDGWSERPPGRTDGILPRSNRRAHIRRWPILARRIDTAIRSQDYGRDAFICLEERHHKGNPKPYYIALMLVTDKDRPILCNRALQSRAELERTAGPDHVLVVSILAERLPADRARIVVQTGWRAICHLGGKPAGVIMPLLW
jgi:hypothetical protein